jgi:hypothetical protein
LDSSVNLPTSCDKKRATGMEMVRRTSHRTVVAHQRREERQRESEAYVRGDAVSGRGGDGARLDGPAAGCSERGGSSRGRGAAEGRCRR